MCITVPPAVPALPYCVRLACSLFLLWAFHSDVCLVLPMSAQLAVQRLYSQNLAACCCGTAALCMQVMDTASLPCSEPKASPHNILSIRSSTKPNVIQEYKKMVKHMIGLLLILGREGSSPAVVQEVKSAASSMVSLLPQPHPTSSACMSDKCCPCNVNTLSARCPWYRACVSSLTSHSACPLLCLQEAAYAVSALSLLGTT